MDYLHILILFLKMIWKKRSRLFILIIIFFIYYFGGFTHFFEKDYYSEFSYPFEGDITRYVEQLKIGETPSLKPLNTPAYNFIINPKLKCVNEDGTLRLVYIVKSAMNNFHRRLAIRHSWGFEKRFSDVPIRTVFVLGVDKDNPKLQRQIEDEHNKFGDIVQAEFIDTYFNNTLKTMVGFKWAVNYCSNSRFYFFSDDDFYISTKNVLRFVRNPAEYPGYLEIPVTAVGNHTVLGWKNDIHLSKIQTSRELNQVMDIDLPEDVKLFAGYAFVSSPHRHQSSKWYTSLSEYPYHMWPPYLTAGSYIVSKQALLDLYYASYYTKYFRFDDIYLGLVANKIGIEPFHCNEFSFYKKDYSKVGYQYVIASHGYGDPNELLAAWNDQKAAGNA